MSKTGNTFSGRLILLSAQCCYMPYTKTGCHCTALLNLQ